MSSLLISCARRITTSNFCTLYQPVYFKSHFNHIMLNAPEPERTEFFEPGVKINNNNEIYVKLCDTK